MRPYNQGPNYFEMLVDLFEKFSIPLLSILMVGAVWAFVLFYLMKYVNARKRRKKKISVEINGIANMHMLLDNHKLNLDNDAMFSREDEEFHNKMKEQLDFTERYFLAVVDAANGNKNVPPWHEVRNSPEKFPNMRERMYGKS